MICREFQCLFVHVPKTAGQSVEQFFMDRLGLDWDADRDKVLLGDNDDPTRGTEKLAHLSALEYLDCGFIERDEFERLFKFSFVRNPFERIVSEYRYRNYFQHRSFRDFVLNKLPEPGWDDKYRHVMPQSDLICSEDGRLLMDFVGKFENLQQDFNRVCEHFGFEDTALPHVNSSDKRSRELRRGIKNFLRRNDESGLRTYVEFYDDETRDYVAQLYRSDIEMFDYSFADALRAP